MGLTAGIGALAGVLSGLNRARAEKEGRARKDFDANFDRIRAQIGVILTQPGVDPQERNQALAKLLEELDTIEDVRGKAIGAASPFRKISKLLGLGGQKKEAAQPEITPEDVVSGAAPPEALIPGGEGGGAEFGRPDADFPPVGGLPVGVETGGFPGVGTPARGEAPEFGPGQRGLITPSGDELFDRGRERLREIQATLGGTLGPGEQASFNLPGGGGFSIEGIAQPTTREELSEQTSQFALTLIDPNASPEERQEATDAIRRLGAAERAEPQEPGLAGAFQAVAFAVTGKIVQTREEFEALPKEQQAEIQKKLGQERPPSAASESFAFTQKVLKIASPILNEVRQAFLPGPTGQPQTVTESGVSLTKRDGNVFTRKSPEELAIEIIQNRGLSNRFIRENSVAIENAIRRLLQTQGRGGSVLEQFNQLFGAPQQ